MTNLTTAINAIKKEYNYNCEQVDNNEFRVINVHYPDGLDIAAIANKYGYNTDVEQLKHGDIKTLRMTPQ